MFIKEMKKLTGLTEKFFLDCMNLKIQKFISWQKDKNLSKKKTPNLHYATSDEVERVIEFKRQNMEIGYKRLTWMMVDSNIAYLSPSSVYRILVKAALNNRWTKPAGEPKKQGFEQPLKAHEQWHIDISYINFKGTFVYLISILDGYSRAILSWDVTTTMESLDVQLVLWRACDSFLSSDFNPRIITDNGSQFLTLEFKQTIKDLSISHTRTSVNHPQSNGKIERFHGTIKNESIRKIPKFTLKQFKEEIATWIQFYNFERLHSSNQYIAPMDVINGKANEILLARQSKLKDAKFRRREFWRKQSNFSEKPKEKNQMAFPTFVLNT
ncbi:MAG: DDE-type integrase/transposase/recombinase [Leptospiraceae bacterium]|nr:DDE-type integrase/transposase/recombinase [Leptospiraceae bacterium]